MSLTVEFICDCPGLACIDCSSSIRSRDTMALILLLGELQTWLPRYAYDNAPSPTGQPHIGNIRTALFNWLFARHYNGKFIVRIEDTDQNRLVDGSIEAILDGLRWLNIDWDEGPEVNGPTLPTSSRTVWKSTKAFPSNSSTKATPTTATAAARGWNSCVAPTASRELIPARVAAAAPSAKVAPSVIPSMTTSGSSASLCPSLV